MSGQSLYTEHGKAILTTLLWGIFMEELKKVPLSGFMAGILIGIGCAVFLSCDSKYVGACFFVSV
jgi:hypothetical protein